MTGSNDSSGSGVSDSDPTPVQFGSITFMEKLTPIIFPSADWYIVKSVIQRHYLIMPVTIGEIEPELESRKRIINAFMPH